MLHLTLSITIVTLSSLALEASSSTIPTLIRRASNDSPAAHPYDHSFAGSSVVPLVHRVLLANFPDPSIYYDSGEDSWYALATTRTAGMLPPPDPSNKTLSTSDTTHAVLRSSYVPSDPAQALSDIRRALPNDRGALLNTSHAALNAAGIQMATSKDFYNWALLNDSAQLLPTYGEWSRGDATSDEPATAARPWAPELIHNPITNQYILYYAATSKLCANCHCIGTATASSPQGPYTPLSTPLACPSSLGGAIDPSAFLEPTTNNTLYLAYKIDGNSLGHGGSCNNMIPPQVSTPILLQRLTADGLSADSAWTTIEILDRIAEDGPLVEAPCLVRVCATYFLFYSSGCTADQSYNVRYATADNIAGPYMRASGPPLLASGDYGLEAPGGATVRTVSGGMVAAEDGEVWRMVLHARVNTSDGGVRALFAAELKFDEARRVVSVVKGSGKVGQ